MVKGKPTDSSMLLVSLNCKVDSIQFLIDYGTVVSVADHKFYKKHISKVLKKSNSLFRSASNTCLTVLGAIQVDIIHAGIEHNQEFVIVNDNLQHPIIERSWLDIL